MMECDWFWGSHGCDLPLGHDGVHECGTNDPDGPCSQYDHTSDQVRFAKDDDPDGNVLWDAWGGPWHGFQMEAP